MFTALLGLCLAAGGAAGADPALSFVEDNNLGSNLYNLLAATIPSTEAGQAIFNACGEVKTEMIFETAYGDLQQDFGPVWTRALADVYGAHLSAEDMAALSALPAETRAASIAERLMDAALVEDLRAQLTPLLSEATARHGNLMLDGAEQLCARN